MSEWQTPWTMMGTKDLARRSRSREGADRSHAASPQLLKPPKTSPRRPRVATVGPTPQMESGALSPLPLTPRIPLADLDHSSLSQRLFHTPGPSSMTSLRLTTPYQVQSTPSEMLMTQSQLSVSPNSVREGVDRSYQQNTERQLLDLHAQVEQLGSMIMKQKQQGSGPVGHQAQVEQLCQEKEQLLGQLEARNRQLAGFKSSLAQLNAEYMGGLAEMKEEARRLTEQVAAKNLSYSVLAGQQEESVARLEALQTQHAKSLKTIGGLQAYIQGLPAKEEVRQLKAASVVSRQESSSLAARGEELERLLGETRERLEEAEQRKTELEVVARGLEDRAGQLAQVVEQGERRRLEARGLGQEEVELLLFDKQELQEENERLRKALELKTKRSSEETGRLEEQVCRVGRLLEESTGELQAAVTDLRLAQGRCQRLEAQLVQKKSEVSSLTQRLSSLSSTTSGLQEEAAAGDRLDGHYTRLARSMGKCLAELGGLHELCTQVMGGGDPNVSVLLGVRQVEVAGDQNILHRDMSSLTVEEKLCLVRSQLQEVTRVQAQIRELRTAIADKYAENLADNMTSCVTQ